VATSPLNRLDDLVGWIEGLRSQEYLADLIRTRHAKRVSLDPRSLARRARPFIEVALDYLEQAERGSAEVAFLPLYYSTLNLAKICILLSPQVGQLHDKLYHGASYNPRWNDQLRLERQKIKLQPNGVMGLFYQALTGEPWVSAATTLTMSRIYPYVANVGVEYQACEGKPNRLAYGTFDAQRQGSDWQLCFRLNQPGVVKRDLEFGYHKALRPHHWRKAGDVLISAHTVSAESQVEDLADCCLRRELIYQGVVVNGDLIVGSPIDRRLPMMVEELPIFAAFFYLSSVARYKPSFMYRQYESRYWPLLNALRRHGMFTFLTAFWSYVHQESVYLVA
jgi:hypothetical protein